MNSPEPRSVLVHVYKNDKTVRLFVLAANETTYDLRNELGDVEGTGAYELIIRGPVPRPLVTSKEVKIADVVTVGESTLSLDVISVAQVELQQQQQQPSTAVAAAGSPAELRSASQNREAKVSGRRGRVRRASCRGGPFGTGAGLVALVVLLFVVAGLAFGVYHSRRRLRGAGRTGRR